MKSPQYAILALVLAAFTASCGTSSVGYIPGAGYSPRDAYYRGWDDGSRDRTTTKNYNPHINEDSSTLPSAHRLEYNWGYIEGYKTPYARYRTSGAPTSSK